ncbi:DUF1385 domain-containing protein [bacterium]|nr:DUF1385 domain-containing protein [bacterium]
MNNKNYGKLSVGGQAVIEGVMMRSPNRISVAVRNPENEIEIVGWKFEAISKRFKILGLPIVRGIVNMGEMLYWGVKTLQISAQIASGEHAKQPSVWSKLWSAISLVFGLAIGVALFAYLPLYISGLLNLKNQPFMFNLLAGLIRVVLFLGYLIAISMMKDVKRLFRYHGAEHKTIFAFENGEPLIPERIQKYSTFHPRCGTSFLLIVAFAAIFFFALVDGIFYSVWGFAPKPIIRLPIHLAFMPILAGISYEFLKLSAKLSNDNRFGKIIVAPGLWLQKITTQPPDNDMLEVAVASLMDSIKDISLGHNMKSKNNESVNNDVE